MNLGLCPALPFMWRKSPWLNEHMRSGRGKGTPDGYCGVPSITWRLLSLLTKLCSYNTGTWNHALWHHLSPDFWMWEVHFWWQKAMGRRLLILWDFGALYVLEYCRLTCVQIEPIPREKFSTSITPLFQKQLCCISVFFLTWETDGIWYFLSSETYSFHS